MSKLDGSVTYLIGGIEYVKDDGVSWRQQIIDSCWDHGLKIKFIDPCNKPIKLAGEIGPEKKRLQRLKEEGKFDEVVKYIHEIRRVDLRFTDYSDFVIAYIDPSVPTCGTWDEIFLAERQKKPILCIINGGPKKAPVWLFDVVPVEEMFGNIQDLVDYLVGINVGLIETDDRWVLVRKQLDEFYEKQQKIQQERIENMKNAPTPKILTDQEINERMDVTLGQDSFERDLINTVKYLRSQIEEKQKISNDIKTRNVYNKTCCGRPGDCNC